MLKPIASPSELFAELYSELKGALLGALQSRLLTPRTRGVKQALQNMGARRGLTVYPSTIRFESEYLLDVIWLDERDDSARKGVVELAAESEFGGLEQVRYDFEKLILVKSPLKLMICDPWKEESDLLPTLEQSIAWYADHRRGETYLVADIGWDHSSSQLSLDTYVWHCETDGPVERPTFTTGTIGPEAL